jgi:hypothetical protein
MLLISGFSCLTCHAFRHSSSVKGITSTVEWTYIVFLMKEFYGVRHEDDFRWHGIYIHKNIIQDSLRLV